MKHGALLIIILALLGTSNQQTFATWIDGAKRAPAAGATANNAVVKPPSCINNKGEQVQFVDVEGRRKDLAAGMARRNQDGKPEVRRANFGAAPAPLQRFIDLHECAHHQTGDVDLPHPPRNGPEHLMNEAVADCIAILRLRDEQGMDAEGLKAVTAALGGDMARVGFPKVSVSSRTRNMRGCYGRGGTAQDLIVDRLKQRGLR